MDIDKLTIGEARELASIFGNQSNKQIGVGVGRYCIVRTYSAGVFAGILAERNGREAKVTNARRIWKWDGAASLSQLAMEGTKNPDGCRFPCEVDEVLLTEVIEIIPTTSQAEQSIKAVKEWKK